MRWLITKTDLLAAQALGYKLRATDALAPLALATKSLPAAKPGASYTAKLEASGGVAPYLFEASGLPEGLEVDSFTGEIKGTPKAAASVDVHVRVRDQDELGSGVEATLKLTIAR
jgi:hypothetical protein